jgi:hypothetical protein
MKGEEISLIWDEHRYIAHPHMARLSSGNWVLVANCGPRRRFTLHPPQDPEFYNVLIRSVDEGRTWSAPRAVPGFGWTGMECAGLTALAGDALLLHQWQFYWYPDEGAPSRVCEPLLRNSEAIRQSVLESSELDSDGLLDLPARDLTPWARGGGRTIVHRSNDCGRTWGHYIEIATHPYSGGYGMRGAIVLDDGEIVLPLADVPNYKQIFLVRSINGGESWTKPEPIASQPQYAFEEPAPLLLASGTIVILLRENVSRTLFCIRSTDGARSWSDPVPTGIDCYPAHLVDLSDSRILAVGGHRRPPFGIFAYWSNNEGISWNVDRPVPIRSGLPSRDLGYPTAALRSDGRLFVAYYYRDVSDVTGVHATVVDI